MQTLILYKEINIFVVNYHPKSSKANAWIKGHFSRINGSKGGSLSPGLASAKKNIMLLHKKSNATQKYIKLLYHYWVDIKGRSTCHHLNSVKKEQVQPDLGSGCNGQLTAVVTGEKKSERRNLSWLLLFFQIDCHNWEPA